MQQLADKAWQDSEALEMLEFAWSDGNLLR